jgi:hypothetical protein
LRRGLFRAALFVFCASTIAAAGGKDKKPPASYAVVAGTVFRDSGFSLPGAEVELAAGGQSQEAPKFKKMKTVSDARGEFAFRVPPVPRDYRVTVKAAGYQVQEKPVSVPGEARVDVFFRLAPASK